MSNKYGLSGLEYFLIRGSAFCFVAAACLTIFVLVVYFLLWVSSYL